MSDAGYTLTETLAALAVLSLTIGGLTAGIGALARGQNVVAGAVADVQALRSAQTELDRILEAQGPFKSVQPERFSGDANSFTLDCGETNPCTVILAAGPRGHLVRMRRGDRQLALPIPVREPARFVYQSGGEASPVWPPGGFERRTLRAVSLVGGAAGAERAILTSTVWREQQADCEFDAILQDCR